MHMRRIVSAIALAGALVLAPTAAMADGYPAPETPNVTTSLPGTVAVAGEPFTVTIYTKKAEAALAITNPDVPSSAIQIAGEQSLRKTPQNGAATFTVTLIQPGNYTLTAMVDGTAFWTMQVTVQAAAGPGAGQGTGGGAGLPVTGTEAALYGVGAVLLIGAGTAVVVGARRRRSATN